MSNIAVFLRLEEEQEILEALRRGKLKVDTRVLPILGKNLQHLRIAKVSAKLSTFKHLEALIKFANGELECLLTSATRLSFLVLEGIPDADIFLDRFCFLLASAERPNHARSLCVHILAADWEQSSLDRVTHATRNRDNVRQKEDRARYKAFQQRMAEAFR